MEGWLSTSSASFSNPITGGYITFTFAATNMRIARFVARLTFALMLVLGAVVALLLLLLRDELGKVFTSDTAVVRIVSEIAPLVGSA